MRPIARIAAVAMLNAFLMISANAQAAAGGGRPAPSKAPLGAPVSDDSTDAYAFRSRMSQDPPCQEISQEADRIFMDANLEVDAKAEQLKQLEARAKQSKCLQRQGAY